MIPEPHDEFPKKRRAWDSNPRATSAVLSGLSVPYHSTTAALAGLGGPDRGDVRPDAEHSAKFAPCSTDYAASESSSL